MIVYGVSAGIVLIENTYQQRKSEAAAKLAAAKEAEAVRQKEANEELQWQEFRELNLRVADLQSRLSAMEAQRGRRWWS